MSEDVEGAIDEAGSDRRTFLRRLAMGSAFAVPVVASFSMAGISAVSASANPPNGVIGNCNTTIIQPNTTISNANGSGFPGFPGFPGGYGNPYTGYGRTPTGNIPVCGNPQGILGFLQTIFSIHPGQPF
jgi:hypothetical protein